MGWLIFVKMKVHIAFLLFFSMLLSLFSCKKCYECQKKNFCSTCENLSTGQSSVICSESFSSLDSYQSAINLAKFDGPCTERAANPENKEICGSRSIVGSALLESDKTQLEFEGFDCNLK
ncbi:MAG: hypothetical protein RLZZ46_124 [Bacteroidota bacterium]